MKVVLTAIHPYPSPQALPLANAFLRAYLATDEELTGGVSVALCDFFVGQDVAACVSAILAENPDAVGISVYLWNRQMAGEVAAALRHEKPRLVLFAGGPEATADPEGVLGDSSYEFLILGEGEIPFVETMAALRAGEGVAGIRGVAFREAGMVVSSRRMPVELLDTIPSPYLAGGATSAAIFVSIPWGRKGSAVSHWSGSAPSWSGLRDMRWRRCSWSIPHSIRK